MLYSHHYKVKQDGVIKEMSVITPIKDKAQHQAELQRQHHDWEFIEDETKA